MSRTMDQLPETLLLSEQDLPTGYTLGQDHTFASRDSAERTFWRREPQGITAVLYCSVLLEDSVESAEQRLDECLAGFATAARETLTSTGDPTAEPVSNLGDRAYLKEVDGTMAIGPDFKAVQVAYQDDTVIAQVWVASLLGSLAKSQALGLARVMASKLSR